MVQPIQKKTSRFMQGYFIPKNPHKYVGDHTKIRYMSSYEYEMDIFLDGNSNVLRWASEEIAIPYIKPTDKKVHHYYPDYWIEYVDKNGVIIRELIEVKPSAQIRPPSGRGKHSVYESLTYAVNSAKWEAAMKWCEHQSIKDNVKITFRFVTEKGLFR